MIIQKVKDGIKRSDIQKEYGIQAGTLSRWICSADKIIGEVNDESVQRHPIQPTPDEGIDEDEDDDAFLKFKKNNFKNEDEDKDEDEDEDEDEEEDGDENENKDEESEKEAEE